MRCSARKGDMANPNPRVVFIGGQGRSGSTLLARLLATHPSVVSVGELMYVAERGFYGRELCSCGVPFDRCAFWQKVLAELTDGCPEEWFSRFRALQMRVARRRSLPKILMAQLLPTRTRVEAGRYSEMLGQLITAVGKVSGAQVVVDSSKEPVHGFHLGRSVAVRLSTVHLVRDCRAVTFSLRRVRVRREVQAETVYMANLSSGRSAFLWLLLNAMAEFLGRREGNYRLVRYESLAGRPDDVVGRLAAALGVGNRGGDAGGPTGESPSGHEVSGNPMRFKPLGSIEPDDRWVQGLPRRDFVISTLVGWPLLLRYRYPLRRGA
jgi:hypothetical protein